MPVISIVSPVYRGEKMVHELVCRIQKNVSGFTEDYEIILVNDASPDNSWQAILQECSIDHRIKGINLSRNFGQHRAILSGLQYAKGDWVIVMDCDLQDKPEEISTLYKKALEGYDVVFAQRVERKDNLLKRMSSTIFYSVFRFLSGVKFDNQVANFGIYKQSVIRTVRNMPERDRSFPVQVSYVGFKTTHIPVTHGQRQEGGSSYTLKTLLKYASGIIISNTNKPMRLVVALGFILSFLSMMMAFYNVIAYFCHMIEVPGFTTTVFSLWFVGGMIMMQIGIVGIYIGKVFDQVKGRPLYVVMDEVNIDKES